MEKDEAHLGINLAGWSAQCTVDEGIQLVKSNLSMTSSAADQLGMFAKIV